MALDLMEAEKWQRDADLEDLEGYRHGTRAAPTIYRAGTLKVAEGDAPMVFIASDEEPDRHGDTIAVDGWDLKAFNSNPVFLWLHGLDPMHQLPIGRVPKVWNEGKQLLSAVQWDKDDAFAAEVHGKYQRGFLKAVSVGFRPLEFEEIKPESGKKSMMPSIAFKLQELLEISAVPVPANPRALQKTLYGGQRYWINPKPKTKETIQPDPLAPIAKVIRDFKMALAGPGGK